VRSNASAVAVVGSLLVAADEPNALIEVDGKALGFTPAVIPNIPIGHRKVRVTLRGYQPIERDIEIRNNAQTDLRDVVLMPERSVSAASRETEAIEDAPASVTVISAQELEAFAYPTILESLRGVRGYAINYDSIYGNAAVRGLGSANDFSNRLLVLSDGAVLNENILYQPFIHYDGRTDLGDVQRIEVVRGPSSVLYGTGAVSGVVNLVLKDRDEPEGVHAQISSYDNSTARGRVGFVERLGRDAGIWASLSGASSQGREVALPGDLTAGTAARTTQDFDKFHSYTLTGKLWFKDLTLQSFWTAREDTIPTGNYGSRFADPRSFGDDQRFMTELKLDHKFGPHASVMVRAHINYAYYHSDYWYDADPMNPQPGTADTYNYFETYKSWWGGSEARATVELGDQLRLTLGGEAVVHERANMEGGQYDVGHTTLMPGLHVDAPYQVFAGSALLDWRPARALRVQAGLRFDYWNLLGNQFAPAGPDRGTTTLSAASPRLAIITKPSDDDIVKLMMGSAFRAPSAYELHLRRQAHAGDDLHRRARGHPQVRPRLGRARVGLRHARARRRRVGPGRRHLRRRARRVGRPDLLSQQPRRPAVPGHRSRAAPRAAQRDHGVAPVRLQLRPLRQPAERRPEPAAEHAPAQRAEPLRRVQGDLPDRQQRGQRCGARRARGSPPDRYHDHRAERPGGRGRRRDLRRDRPPRCALRRGRLQPVQLAIHAPGRALRRQPHAAERPLVHLQPHRDALNACERRAPAPASGAGPPR
jgi:hypothetical protein